MNTEVSLGYQGIMCILGGQRNLIHVYDGGNQIINM